MPDPDMICGVSDIVLVKSADQTILSLGDTVTFCLAIANYSGSSQTFNVWDTVPDVLTYVDCDNSCSTSGDVVYWSVTLANGASVDRCFWAYASSLPYNWIDRAIFAFKNSWLQHDVSYALDTPKLAGLIDENNDKRGKQ